LKSPGTATLTKKIVIEYGKKRRNITDFNYFLGHTQAPTSSQRAFSPTTSHPFQFKDWLIAHNGVLTNHKELKQLIANKKSYNVVDSSIIAPLLDMHLKKHGDEILSIIKTLSLLKGTFGLWIYNQKSGNIYIARSGSTLYADFLNNEFSSLPNPDNGFVEVEQGLLYLLTKEGITSVGKFATNSPFFNP
jgi:glucosamine--fructose-6-phosphate aminotransferase (isomerizing)